MHTSIAVLLAWRMHTTRSPFTNKVSYWSDAALLSEWSSASAVPWLHGQGSLVQQTSVDNLISGWIFGQQGPCTGVLRLCRSFRGPNKHHLSVCTEGRRGTAVLISGVVNKIAPYVKVQHFIPVTRAIHRHFSYDTQSRPQHNLRTKEPYFCQSCFVASAKNGGKELMTEPQCWLISCSCSGSWSSLCLISQPRHNQASTFGLHWIWIWSI